MLNEQNIRDAIVKSVLDVDIESLGKDDNFTDAGMDSLDHASILLYIQEHHELVIPDEAVDDCMSIQGILNFAKSLSS